MPTIVSTLPCVDDVPRFCLWCREIYQPSHIDQKYCKPTHATAAKEKRKKECEDLARRPKFHVLRCGWTGHEFESPDPGWKYCSDNHRTQARNCERKERYLTEEAAEAAARLWTRPGS